MSSPDQILTKLSWHLPGLAPGSDFTFDELRVRYWVFFDFLQRNALVTRQLATSIDDVHPEAALLASDLTPDGRQLFRTGYQRWIAALDRAGPAGRMTKVHDTRLLEKYLREIRSGAAGVESTKLASTARRGERTTSGPKEDDSFRPQNSSKRAARSTSRTSSAHEASTAEVFDKAKWHSDGEFPKGIPATQAFVHTGIYLGWVIDNGLTSAEFAADLQQEIQRFKARQLTGPGVYRAVDGVFSADMLSENGAAFTRHYFDFKKGKFLRDYEAMWVDRFPSAYHVPDTWESYDAIKPVIDRRYQAWRRGQARSEEP